MKATTPLTPPTFSNEEELRALLIEGVHSGDGVVMTREEWQRLRDELAPLTEEQRRAS